MNPNTASLYRQSAVRGASPIGLVVILYEEVIRSLQEALNAIDGKNVEQRSIALTHVLGIVGHLQAVLNYEKGGEVARKLSVVYDSVRDRVFHANIRADRSAIQRLLDEFLSLAEAWREVERRETPQSQAGSTSDGASEPVLEESSLRWSS